jgi:hypothetical protein
MVSSLVSPGLSLSLASSMLIASLRALLEPKSSLAENHHLLRYRWIWDESHLFMNKAGAHWESTCLCCTMPHTIFSPGKLARWHHAMCLFPLIDKSEIKTEHLRVHFDNEFMLVAVEAVRSTHFGSPGRHGMFTRAVPLLVVMMKRQLCAGRGH